MQQPTPLAGLVRHLKFHFSESNCQGEAKYRIPSDNDVANARAMCELYE